MQSSHRSEYSGPAQERRARVSSTKQSAACFPRMPSSTSGDRQTIAATIILRRNENTGQDEVFLEERLDTAVGGGTIGIVGGKLDQKDVGEVKERCRLEGLELTPSQFSDEVAKVANLRELREEVEFMDGAGQPLAPSVQGPFGRLKLARYEYAVFVARIPPSASVRFSAEYGLRVQAFHWKPFMEALADRHPSVMPSTVPLLGLYLYLDEVKRHMASFKPGESATTQEAKAAAAAPSARKPEAPVETEPARKKQRALDVWYVADFRATPGGMNVQLCRNPWLAPQQGVARYTSGETRTVYTNHAQQMSAGQSLEQIFEGDDVTVVPCDGGGVAVVRCAVASGSAATGD